ncbi:hypothetical protein HDU79_008826 [Rhizoclosmatium sp. JEL0117]|nr:hypothetical protein HDU79_008826 [Rhizoclosmatium sp. JEL0117]
MKTTIDLDALAILQEHTEFVVERAIRLSLDDSKEAGVSWQKMMTEVGGLSRLWDPVDEAMDDDNDEDYDPELEQESLLEGEDMDTTDDECIESEVSNSDSEFEDDVADWVTSEDEDTPEYSPLNSSFLKREREIQIFTDMVHYEDPERSNHNDTQVHYLAQLHSETSIVDRCMPLDSVMKDETIEQLYACIRQYSSLQNALGTTPIHLVNRAKHLFRECDLTVDPSFTNPAWSPFTAGLGLGLAQLVSVLFTQSVVGASSVYPYLGSVVVCNLDKNWEVNAPFYSQFKGKSETLRFSVGVILGGLISFVTTGLNYGGGISSVRGDLGVSAGVAVRLILGGVVLVYGSRVAGGCPSGHGISGMAQLSLASLISVAAMFAGGTVFAFIVGEL